MHSSVDNSAVSHEDVSLLRGWSTLHSYLLLAGATILCLIPFSGRAFHVDDTLFVWAAQNIAKHPFNPYGFQLIWEFTRVPMSEVTQNPPLASYYGALIGGLMGWSEWAMHAGFLPISVLLVLGTYRLARRFTRSPLLAALIMLLTPGFLVSASSIMCDVMMLAIWVWAVVFWVEGSGPRKPLFLIASGGLITAAALTKYFGVALIPLLLAYSFVRERRFGSWAFYLLIPVAGLIGYQLWTSNLYTHGLLVGAAAYAEKQRALDGTSPAARVLITLSYAGGCALPGLLFAPLVWPRKQVITGLGVSILAGLCIALSWVNIGLHEGGDLALTANGQYGFLISSQLILCIAGGVSVLALAMVDTWEEQSPDALFLAMWIVGTLFFSAFVNWTINVRSVLPLIPAAGILLARRLDKVLAASLRPMTLKVAVALLLCSFISVWIARADAELANSARRAATLVWEKTRNRGGTLWFAGHWGFQYYMELLGGRPVDWDHPMLRPGDFVVMPLNNANMRIVNPEYVASQEYYEVPMHSWAGTISPRLGAGFYSSYWGPLPFAIGRISPERYWVVQISPAITSAVEVPGN
jgi:4-amino-4-deoxy-L-arabinose transferase-like glycosyltransferase